MTKYSGRAKQPMAQRGAKMKEMYRLYSLSGDPDNLKKNLASIIGVEGGKISYTYTNEMIKDMLSRFFSPLDGGTRVKDTDLPDKYFKALEARFLMSSRMLLEKTAEEDK